MQNIILSTKNIDDFISDVANEVVKRMELWQTNKPTTQSETKEYLTRKEAAAMLNISLPTLWALSKNGTIKSHRIGSRVLYKTDELKTALTQVKTSANL